MQSYTYVSVCMIAIICCRLRSTSFPPEPISVNMLLVYIMYFTYNATLVKSVYIATSSVLLNLATIHYKTQEGYYTWGKGP